MLAWLALGQSVPVQRAGFDRVAQSLQLGKAVVVLHERPSSQAASPVSGSVM